MCGKWRFRLLDFSGQWCTSVIILPVRGCSGGWGRSESVRGGGKGEARGRGRERERETEIRQKRKRGEGTERNEVSLRERHWEGRSEADGNEERRREGGLWRAGEARSFLTRGDRSTVNHSLIPSSLCPLPHSLHMNRGYVILIKRSRVTVEPSVCTGHGEARGAWNILHNTNLSSPLPHTWLATVGSSV